MAELDYAQLDAAAAGGQPGVFDTVSRALGVQLFASHYAAMQRWSAQAHAELRPALMFAVIRRALAASHGIAVERVEKPGRVVHVLAVRVGGVVTVGARREYGSKKLSSAWPELEGWKPKLELNVALAASWAGKKADDRITLEVRDDLRLPEVGGDEEHALLEAISLAPDDDAPRLVYADWLMERGDARAELIRLQLELQRSPHDVALKKRVDAMLESSWSNFAGELAPWADTSSFERGVVTRVRMTPAAFVKEGERLFSTYPLQSLTVDAPRFTSKQLEQLSAAPGMARVRRLTLAQGAPGAMPRLPLASLAKGTRFESLRALSFMSCGHSAKDWEALFTRLEAPKLEEVEFSFNHTHPALWRALAFSPALTQLRCIDEYTFRELEPGEGREEFAEAMQGFAQHRPKLETLILSQVDHLDDESFFPLFANTSRVQLRTLDLNGAKLSDETLRAWQKGGRLGELRSLTVRNSHFTAEGVAQFLDAGVPPKLEHLSLIAFDELRWNHASLGLVYEALLALPKNTPLKRVALPQGRRGYDALFTKVSSRFEIEP